MTKILELTTEGGSGWCIGEFEIGTEAKPHTQQGDHHPD